MKVLKRLNAVTAAEKMDFDTFFGIMKKHKNDATEIVNKALAPVFNKLPVPLYKANDSYERVGVGGKRERRGFCRKRFLLWHCCSYVHSRHGAYSPIS